jgi:hypothetical protein
MSKLKRINKNNRSEFRHKISRRKFLGSVATGAAFTIVPRTALGGKGNVSPGDKTTLALIGMG